MTLKPEYLDRILTLLVKNQVTSFKMGELEISLSLGPKDMQDSRPSPQANPQVAQEPFTEPDLRADDLMNEKAVLFYSSPDADASDSIPLTGDHNGTDHQVTS